MTSLHRRPLFAPPRIELFINTEEGLNTETHKIYRVAQLRIPVASKLIAKFGLATMPKPEQASQHPLFDALAQSFHLADVESGGEGPLPTWMHRWATTSSGSMVLHINWANRQWRHYHGWTIPNLWMQLRAVRTRPQWHTVELDVLLSQQSAPPTFGRRLSDRVVLLDLVPVELRGA